MAFDDQVEVSTQVLSSWLDRQVAGDVRQRDVGDAGVEHLHERRQRDDQRDRPRVVAAGPAGREVGGRRRPPLRRAALIARVTFGSTDMPGRRRSSPAWPASKRMRTGMRCTTFT